MTSADSRVFFEDGDPVNDDARNTANLLGSLAARLGTLFAISGADAIGAQIAGFAAVGRQVSRMAYGARYASPARTVVRRHQRGSHMASAADR